MANRYSPNWFWQQLGYTVERHGKAGKHRRVTDQNGIVIYDGCDALEACAIGQRLYLDELRTRRSQNKAISRQ